jgi:hypothetical protein
VHLVEYLYEGTTLVCICLLFYGSFEHVIVSDGTFIVKLIIISCLLVYVKFFHCVQVFTFLIVILDRDNVYLSKFVACFQDVLRKFWIVIVIFEGLEMFFELFSKLRPY